MQKDAWSKFSLDSLVTNRDKKFCDADTLTEEMKELLIKVLILTEEFEKKHLNKE